MDFFVSLLSETFLQLAARYHRGLNLLAVYLIVPLCFLAGIALKYKVNCLYFTLYQIQKCQELCGLDGTLRSQG